MSSPKLVLASQSPRRREILSAAGYVFEVRVAGLEESRLPGEAPEEYVTRLARDKARAIQAGPLEFVLAADTTVVCESEVMEKPVDAADARRMLGILSGRVHQVWTGVCLRVEEQEWACAEVTQVRFLPLSHEQIAEYVATGEPMDKAGAYAIQGRACRFIDRVEGCYFNVVGLPISRVARMLVAAGFRA